MSAQTVLVTSRSFSTGHLDLVARLTAANAQVVRGAPDHNLDSLRPVLAHAVAWIAGTGPVTAEHLTAAPTLQLVARYGVGVDAVDVEAASSAGIYVTNTPGANSNAVAEHTLALLLASLRRVVSGDRSVRAGDWSVQRARELRNLTVGIVGFGRIGRALTARLLPFGTVVLVYDPAVSDVDIAAAGATPCDLPDLPGRCDAVSLHAPGQHRLVDAEWLRGADPHLILLNTARASLVDEQAVATALATGGLGAYAADDIGGGHGEVDSPLLAQPLSDRVIVTPHSAAQTVEAVDNMSLTATEAVLAVLAGHPPANIVSGP